MNEFLKIFIIKNCILNRVTNMVNITVSYATSY